MVPGITRASFSNTGREVVVRNEIRSVLLLCFSGLAVLAIASVCLADVVDNHNAATLIAGPLVCAGTFYPSWLFARHATIRLKAKGIVIENMFFRHEIPWGHGRQFYISNGIRLQLLDGTSCSTWAFQGSVGAAVNGYKAFEPIVERLTKYSDKIVKSARPEYPPPPRIWRFQAPDWWIPLAIAGGVEALLGLAWLISGR